MRVETKSEQIFMYIPDADKRRQIEALCRVLKTETGDLSYEDRNTPLKDLLGLKDTAFTGMEEAIRGSRKETGKCAPPFWKMPELLLFSGLPDAKLNAFLKAYREAGIPPVPLKAVVTPYNLFWPPYELACELDRERAAVAAEMKEGKNTAEKK